MPLTSAGILLYQHRTDGLRVLLVHPGGPFWRSRDAGAWQIPKGVIQPGEEPAAAAAREFEEELGLAAPGTLRPLARIRQTGGKWVEAFAAEGSLDIATINSNCFDLEWPPRSGVMQSFPEVDRAEWFTLAEARVKILPSQAALLDALEASADRN